MKVSRVTGVTKLSQTKIKFAKISQKCIEDCQNISFVYIWALDFCVEYFLFARQSLQYDVCSLYNKQSNRTSICQIGLDKENTDFRCNCMGFLVPNTHLSPDRRMARVRPKAAMLAPAPPVKCESGTGGRGSGVQLVPDQHRLHHGLHDGAAERRVQGGFRRVWHGEGSSDQYCSKFPWNVFCLFCSSAGVWLHSNIKVFFARHCFVCFGFVPATLCEPSKTGVQRFNNKLIWSD